MTGWQLTRSFRSAVGQVRWDRFGDSGPPIVLLHGTPFSSFIWRSIARSLAPHHVVYVWDMPGYGTSAQFDGQDLSLDALSGVFADLLEYWELSEPAVVAHDSGGAIALGTHLLREVPYERLALVDAVSLPPWGSAFFEVVGEQADVFVQLPSRLHQALVREYVTTACSTALRPEILDALVQPWLGDHGQPAFYRQLEQRRADPGYVDQFVDRYAEIDIPVVVCWGADDTWVPADRGRELAARIPGAGLRIIPGAGHLVHEDRPAELTAALLAFLHDLA